MLGLHAGLMEEYLQFIADRRLARLVPAATYSQ